MKNTFVIAPLLFTGSFTNFDNLFESFIAIIIFCLASSVAYIFNDYRDIDLDRNHPIKSLSRPLASNAISTSEVQNSTNGETINFDANTIDMSLQESAKTYFHTQFGNGAANEGL